MDIRCGSCNKLFRVSDDKITGSGVKFKCSGCGEYVKITQAEFEQYALAKSAAVPPHTVPAQETTAPAPLHAAPAPPKAAPPVSPAPPALELTGYEVHAPAAPEAAAPAKTAPPVPHPPEKKPGVPPPVQPAAASGPSPQAAPPAPEKKKAAPAPARPASAKKPPSAPAPADIIHPLLSGAFAGSVGGLFCAIVVIAAMLMTAKMKLIPSDPAMNILAFLMVDQADRPMAIARYMGFGILLGVILAMLQSRAQRKMFSLLGILITVVLGALIGAALTSLTALFGAGLKTSLVIAGTEGWSVKAFLIGAVIVVTRRVTMPVRKESFSARLSEGQIVSLVLALALVGLAVYGEVIAVRAWGRTAQTARPGQDLYSPAGLTVANSSGAIDDQQDLVINGVVENTTPRDRIAWYLVAEVFDAQGTKLTEVRLLNGRQFYTDADYTVLASRGVNVSEFKQQLARQVDRSIPPNSSVTFELKVIQPPIGIASFLVQAKPFDPALAEEFLKSLQ